MSTLRGMMIAAAAAALLSQDGLGPNYPRPEPADEALPEPNPAGSKYLRRKQRGKRLFRP